MSFRLGEAVTDPVGPARTTKQPVAECRDVGARVAFVSDFLLREVLG